MVPIIRTYQRWIKDLSTLLERTSEEHALKAKKIEAKHIREVKPTARSLSLFEAFADLPSKEIFT